MNMILVEFIEATARVADKLTIPPLIDEEEMEEDRDSAEKIHASVKRRFKKLYPGLRLALKIETLIYLMARSCLKKGDIETMEKNVLKYYEERKNAPKATKYAISNKLY